MRLIRNHFLRFKIRLAQEELEKLVTVKDVLDLLEVKFAALKEAA